MASLMTANAHILRGEQEKGDHRKMEEGYIARGLGTMAKFCGVKAVTKAWLLVLYSEAL